MTDPTIDIALGKRDLLRHAVATRAYRGGKAIRNAPPELADFRIGDGTRSPLQILAHLGDLLEWGVSLAEGNQKWNVATPPRPLPPAPETLFERCRKMTELEKRSNPPLYCKTVR